jgi:uncharacterized membrane protein
MESTKPDKATMEAWLHDLNNYKGKYFYYNKQDKRILPPRRIKSVGIGMNGPFIKPNGWVINFANPYSVLVLILLLAVIILPICLFAK